MIFQILYLLISVFCLASEQQDVTNQKQYEKPYIGNDLISTVPNNIAFSLQKDDIKYRSSSMFASNKQNGFIPENKVVIRRDNIAYVVANNEQYNAGQSRKEFIKKNLHNDRSYNPDFLYKDNFYIIKSDWKTINGFLRENWYDVAQGYKNVCKRVKFQQDQTPVRSQILQIGTMADLKKICMEIALLQEKSDVQIRNYFIRNFTPYLIGDDEVKTNSGLFTGYYYPTLNASRVRTTQYRYPIYKKPPELGSRPYFTRKQINDGALNGRGLEIFWVDDFVDLYFLHIQGSGMLKLTDGNYAHVKFSAKNNQPYESLGKYMLQKGYIRKGSDTKSFLQRNESVAHDILSVNKSYIFFQENYENAVIGAHGSELVDGRSLAVDPYFIPYGAMLFVDTKNHSKAMFAQDTGSAIKGKIRGDIFVGKGYEAGERAKITHNSGFMYILVHKDQNIRII
jgi:membrane-bound lytic murein transglycosylase A